MSSLIDDVRKLKSQAMTARDTGDAARAIELLNDADQLLHEALSDLRQHRPATEPPGSYETGLATQLVHIRGTKGGVYRRTGDYAAAVAAYDASYQIEGPGSDYPVVDSYALTQRLVTRLLLVPSGADPNGAEVVGLDVRQALHEAETEIRRQVVGERANDEYAAADLAVVQLLLGSEDWDQALDAFLDAAPEPYAVSVTLATLRELLSAARAATPPPAALIDRLITACEELAVV
jgi:tetratricopeptide (TPR) repeat protein